MLRTVCIFAVAIAYGTAALAQITVQRQQCSDLNYKMSHPYANSDPNSKEHSSGDHSWLQNFAGSCSYSGSAQPGFYQPCQGTSVSTSISGGNEGGSTFPYWHETNEADKNGYTIGAAGAVASSDAEGAFAVNSCAIFPCGSPAVTITGGGNGGGFSVSYAGSRVIYTNANHVRTDCTAYQLAPAWQTSCPNPNPPTPPYNTGYTGSGSYWYWDVNACAWENAGSSPVIIDTKNAGFHFTDPDKGDYVSFDIAGDGHLFKVSWPHHGSGNAWLALPDGDGNVKDGKHLFGNHTYYADQNDPDNNSANGFNALAYYDRPDQGGNLDLMIDSKDAIWPKLRLWIDEHCYRNPDQACISEPKELHKLEEFGIDSISLVWGSTFLTDKVGNEFRFWTYMNPDAHTQKTNEKGEHCCDLHQKSKDGRKAYDVFLKVKKD